MSTFAHRQAQQGMNIVLVHGAWADGSCWSAVIERLQADGYTVTAPQFPMTMLADKVARLRQVLARQNGPTITALWVRTHPTSSVWSISRLLGLTRANRSAHCWDRDRCPGARAPRHRRAGLRLVARGRLPEPLRG